MRYRFLILSVFSLFTLASCEEWMDVNTDPNNPVEITPALSLPVAQNYTARWMHRDRGINHLGNMLMYNWSEAAGFSWYNDEFLYRANSTSFYASAFDYAYQRGLKQYADIENNYDRETYAAYVGISKVMQSYTYQILVDMYGDIPYTEALQRATIPAPKYDQAAVIYDSLIMELSTAIALFDAAESSSASVMPGADDLMFGGDMMRWKKFANTVKLRIINRAAGAKGNAWATEKLAEIAAEGSGYITQDVTIQAGYLNEENKQNPYWEGFGQLVNGTPVMTGQATVATDYILNLLDETADPRIGRLYQEDPTGFLGVPQGIVANPATQGFAQASNIGPGILKGATQASIIFTLAEHYFNAAELALKGFNSGETSNNPQELYESGVAASFATLGATGVSTYLAQSRQNVSYAASSNKLEAIITQKWLAVNGLTAEQSWFDWVRTGFPSNLPVSREAPNLRRPVRLSYPASEVGGNTSNVPTQPNVFDTKIFWATNQ